MLRALLLTVLAAIIPHAAFAQEIAVPFSWTAPTTRTDGSPLDPAELHRYILSYRIGDAPEVVLMEPLAPALTATVTLNLLPGTHTFSLRAVDKFGLTSAPSTKTMIIEDIKVLPSSPAWKSIMIKCNGGCYIKVVEP